MSPALARLVLHSAHLLTFAVVFASGLMLFLPNLREAVTGGYSLLIRDAHRWGGVAFAALPTLIIMRFGVSNVFVAPAERSTRTLWQAVHLALTVAMTLIFTITGFVIWWKRWLPEAVVDLSRLGHDNLTYAAAALPAFTSSS